MAYPYHGLTTKGQITTTQWHTRLKRRHSCFFILLHPFFRVRSICYDWNVRFGKSLLSNGVSHWHTTIRRSKPTNIVFHTYVHSGRAKKIQNGSDSGQRPLQSWVLYWHTAINVMSMCCLYFCVVWRKKEEDETKKQESHTSIGDVNYINIKNMCVSVYM